MRVYKIGEIVIRTDQPIIDLGLTDRNFYNPKPVSRNIREATPIVGRRKPGRPPGSKTKK